LRAGLGDFRRLGALLFVTVALAAGFLSPRLIPYDMDEFTAFHPLGCAAYPLSRALNLYRERCGEYDLTPPLLGRPLPLRSYLYIGSVPTLPFWVFWRTLHDPVAVRVQGAVFFVLALGLFRSLLRSRYSAALLSMCLFPVFPVAFFVDTGPVGLCLVLLLCALLLVRASLESERPHVRLLAAAGAGLALFLGLWVKLVFAWCLPAVAVLAGAWTARSRGGPKRGGVLLLCALGVLVPLSGLLLWSTTAEGSFYLEVVRRGGVSTDPEDVAGVARSLSGYVINASAVLPRIFTFPRSVVDFAPGLAGLVLLVWGGRDPEVVAYGVASLVTFLVTDLSTRALEAHHAVFFMVFLLLGLGRVLDRTSLGRLATALVIATSWGSLALRLPTAEVDPRRNFEKDALLRDIRESHWGERTLALHASWGTYYIAHLFGDPGQAVLFSKKFTESREMLEQVKAAADRLNRGILLITRKPDRLEGPPVSEILGPPLKSVQEGNWWAVEYLRE
jgi:hypothetical protein